jgi:hypothetical protein
MALQGGGCQQLKKEAATISRIHVTSAGGSCSVAVDAADESSTHTARLRIPRLAFRRNLHRAHPVSS